jgi:energy-coupling factor transporter ATP-binding protein EcfA2
MRLKTAHVRNYRSVRDTGVFDIEQAKTILVGPNEAGKTAILQAIQQLNPPEGVKKFEALRDYPRGLYNEITRGAVDPKDVPVVTGEFELEDADRELLPEAFEKVRYSFTRHLANTATHDLVGGPQVLTYGELKKDLLRLGAHMDAQAPALAEGQSATETPSAKLAAWTSDWRDQTQLTTQRVAPLRDWLKKTSPLSMRKIRLKSSDTIR